jgi:glucoamylase
MQNEKVNAPGDPGIEARWTSSAKFGLGKSINPASKIAFTLSHGILDEIHYPREDIGCKRDMGWIVTDWKVFFQKKKDTLHGLESTNNI